MARTTQLYDWAGRPIRQRDLGGEQGGPDAMGVRSYADLAPAKALSASRLSTLLSSAARGDLAAQARLFDDMEEKDAHIYAEMGKRQRAVVGLDAGCLPYDDSAGQARMAEYVQENLDALGIENLVMAAADGIGKGVSCTELLWDISGGGAAVREAKHRPLAWFQWERDGVVITDGLRIADGTMDGAELLPGKWIVHRHPSRSGSPFRGALYRVLAWLFLFRNYSTKAWARFVEGFGIPLRVGKYPLGTGKTEQDLLLDAVSTIATEAAVIIPEGMTVDIVDVVQRGGASPHKALLDWAGKEISKAILGATLTTDSDGKGSYGLGKVHEDVRRDILASDARLIAGSLNRQLVKPLVELNFGPQKTLPYLRIEVPEPEDLKLLSEVVTALVGAGFDEIPLWWIRERFGIPGAAEGDETLADLVALRKPAWNARGRARGGTGAHGASLEANAARRASQGAKTRFTGEQEAVEGLADAAMALLGDEPDENAAAFLREIEAAEGYEEAMLRVLELAPALKGGRMAEALERGALNAALFGKWAAGGRKEK